MRRTQPRILLAALASLSLAAIGGFFWLRFDPYAKEVRVLVSRLSANGNFREPEASAVRELVRLGPKADPEIARIFRGHDTPWDRRYDQLKAKVPKSVRQILPDRLSKDDLRIKAYAVVEEIGPTACRQLLGPIHDALCAEDGPKGYELLRCLYWSIPESPKAVETLRVWLSRPAPRRMLFGMKDADEIWPQVPQLAPLLVEWLKLPDQAGQAADALGQMGSNAVRAIPALIDTFDHFVAGNPPKTNLALNYAESMEPLQWNRTAAIRALGRIGIASPEVLAALERGMSDERADVRVFTADAIGSLGAKALPLLPKLLEKLDQTNRLVLEYQIEAIGKMGAEAALAIPMLKHWAKEAIVAALPPVPGIGRVVRWFDEPPPLPAGAAIALLRMAPQEAIGTGRRIAAALLPGPNAQRGESSRENLRRLRPLAGEIVPALEASLGDQRPWVRQLAAFQILCLDPDHAKASALLLRAMKEADPISLRAQAANFYWQLTGDTELTLPVLRQALETVKDAQTQHPLHHVAELGAAAKPVSPQIQSLLTNEDRIIRNLAGKALRRIAPELLPPINESSP